MARKTAQKVKSQEIKKIEQYLEELEFKQIITCIGITFNEYVKHVTKSSLVGLDGESKDAPLVDRAGAVLVGISSRIGGDTLSQTRRLRSLYGIKEETNEPIKEEVEGDNEATENVATEEVAEETPEATDGTSVQD